MGRAAFFLVLALALAGAAQAVRMPGTLSTVPRLQRGDGALTADARLPPADLQGRTGSGDQSWLPIVMWHGEQPLKLSMHRQSMVELRPASRQVSCPTSNDDTIVDVPLSLLRHGRLVLRP